MGTDHGGNGGEPRLPRRLVLKSLAAGAALWEPACGAPPLENAAANSHGVASARPLETPIRIENRLLGTDTLALQRPALAGEVEGYASTTSAIAGESVRLCVNVARAQRVRWDLYRIGYYQGHGARLIGSGPAVAVSPQPAPSADPGTGLLECAWKTAFSVVIDANWVTGYYLFKLSNEDGFESYVPLVVRESARRAPLLVQASVTTWQAYNRWGGISLYVNLLPSPSPFSGPRGYQVSFDRPYGPGEDIGSVEYAMVRWLEQQGYDVAYATNIDIDRAPELLSERQLFMSLGHDEYWSLTERNAVQAARDQGLCLAFFGGNPAYRRIRLEHSAAGVERRVITCYKSPTLDPHRDAPDTTSEYHDRPYPRPENELAGVVWAGWANLQGFPFVVTRPDHWLYEGTGVQAGDTLGHIVGYEWDATSSNGHSPPGLEVVAESLVLHEYAYTSVAHATVYYPTQSSFVFAAGTVGWARGLGDKGFVDPRVQRVTENILLRAGLFPEARVVVPPPPSPPLGGAARSLVVAGTGAAGRVDGPAASAQFNAPAGVAAGPNGELYVCDTGNHLLRKISADGQVSTLFGHGKHGLDTPTGVVVDAQGNVFVSDTGNHRIVVVNSDGHGRLFAGRARGHGFADAPDAGNARFNQPRGLALDAAGALYVADFRNDAIRRIDASGVTTLVRPAGGPTALAVAADGTLYYVATWLGAIIGISPSGERRVLANPSSTYGDRTGPGAQAALRPCEGLALTETSLVFSDTANNRVRTLAFDGTNTVANLVGSGRGGNATGTQTELYLPRGLSAVNDGYVLADSGNHRILHFSSAVDALPVK